MGSRIKEAMDDLRSGRNSWIFNKDGSVKDNVLVIDALEILNEMRDVEINVDSDELMTLLAMEDYDDERVDGNISNDLQVRVLHEIDIFTDDTPRRYDNVAIVEAHIGGDSRGNYTEPFVIDLGDYDTLREFLTYEDFTIDKRETVEFQLRLGGMPVGNKEIGYYAEYSIFDDSVTVYDKNDDYVEDFCVSTKEELLESLSEYEKEQNDPER